MRAFILGLLVAFTASAAAQDGRGTPLAPYALTGATFTLNGTNNATTAPLDLFVETTGSDSNDCLSLVAPCLTLQGAFDKVPLQVSHPVTITLGTGSFTGGYLQGRRIKPASAAVGAWVVVQGTMAAATVATGTASGTSTGVTAESGVTRATLTDSGQSWTVNDLRGKLLCLTSGTNSGACAPIISNTATVITHTRLTLTAAINATAGDQYAIRDWSSNVNALAGLPGRSLDSASTTSTSTSGAAIALYDIEGGAGIIAPSGAIYIQKLKTSASAGIFLNNVKGGTTIRWNSHVGAAIFISLKFTAGVTMISNHLNCGGSGFTELNNDNTITAYSIAYNYYQSAGRGAVLSGGASSSLGVVGNEVTAQTGFLWAGTGYVGGSSNSITCTSTGTGFDASNFSVGGSMFLNLTGTNNVNSCVTALKAYGSGAHINAATITGTGNFNGIAVQLGGHVTVTTNSLTSSTNDVNMDVENYTLTQIRSGQHYGATGLASGSAYNENMVQGAIQLGSVLVPANVAAGVTPTCSAVNIGGVHRQLGGAGEGASKLCYCSSDGAASPTYKWCSFTLTTGTYTCAGGTSASCP